MDKKLLSGLMDSMVDVNQDMRFKGLFYGDPGARKTVETAKIGKRVLMVAADPEGWVSLKNHPELGLGTRIKVMGYQGISQLEALANAFEDDEPFVREFDTVHLDTLSHMASMDLDVVQKQKMKKKGDDFDFEKDMWPVYNQNSLRVKNALVKLLHAPINVVATAHSREVEIKRFGSATGERRLQPKFSPEIFSAINADFSMIAYMECKTGVDKDGNISYKCETQFHPTPLIVAKARIGGLPVKVKNADLKEIVDNWLSKGGDLIPHEEAELERPADLGFNPALADLQI